MEINALFILWIISGLFIVFESRLYRIIIYFGIFSLISSVVYLFLGAPDVAMAEAGISAFTTVFFIIFVGKYYGNQTNITREKIEINQFFRKLKGITLPFVFCAGLFALYIYTMPDTAASTYLKEWYLSNFISDVGGKNAVTAILLAYRVYDTLFEALILVVSVVAVVHMSHFSDSSVSDGHHSEIENSGMAVFTLRIICPIIVLFGGYLVVNGHISAGGGFQGGLAVATFFICRYMVYNIYDISVKRVMQLEELIFLSIILLSIIAVFLGAAALLPTAYLPMFQRAYLILMNVFIGLKVACGFFILFYRYIAFERR
ncbi:MAG: DUF4040 domain-containing protein [Defluviitaleaceae bacterium]|nr:DUF4040 domain-containing protein [Defluviitaleaceae bacterium]